MAKATTWNAAVLLALLAAFLGTLARWWLYFGTAGKDAIATITQSGDPGRIGAYFHYVHAILVAGIIATAVGNDLVLAHPHDAPSVAYILVLCGGPAIYLLGSAIYKKVVYDSLARRRCPGACRTCAIGLRCGPSGDGLDDHGRDVGRLRLGSQNTSPLPSQ